MTRPTDQIETVTELLAVHKRWTTEAMARDEYGEPVDPMDPAACCWCLVGALEFVYGGGPPEAQAIDRLYAVIRDADDHEGISGGTQEMELVDWNDQVTWEQVIEACATAGI